MYKTIDEAIKNAHAGDVFQLYNDISYHYTLRDEWCYEEGMDGRPLRIFVDEDDFTGSKIDMITRYWHYDPVTSSYSLVFVKEE